MKLSEILKDWPKEWKPIASLRSGDPRCEGFNTAITSCDREIDREALARIMAESTNKAIESKSWNDAADHIISTMPNWLKRIEK